MQGLCFKQKEKKSLKEGRKKDTRYTTTSKSEGKKSQIKRKSFTGMIGLLERKGCYNFISFNVLYYYDSIGIRNIYI